MGAGNYIQHWCAWYRAGVGCDARLAVILVTWLGCCPVALGCRMENVDRFSSFSQYRGDCFSQYSTDRHDALF